MVTFHGEFSPVIHFLGARLLVTPAKGHIENDYVIAIFDNALFNYLPFNSNLPSGVDFKATSCN